LASRRLRRFRRHRMLQQKEEVPLRPRPAEPNAELRSRHTST
jgi:hypothetical protein